MSKFLKNIANLNYDYKTEVGGEDIPKSAQSDQISTFSTKNYPLSIDKYSTPEFLDKGERLTYTIVITNYDVSSASNAQILDTLQTGLSYGNDAKLYIDGTLIDSTKLTENHVGNALDFTITEAIPTEGIAVITFTAINNSISAGTTISNTATLKHALLPTAGITSDTVSSKYSFAEVNVIKDLVNSTNTHLDVIKCGSEFYYKITLQNIGDLAASIKGYDDVEGTIDGFTDTLPSGFNFITTADYTNDIIIGSVNDPLDTTTNKKLSALTTMHSSYDNGTRALTLGNFSVDANSTKYIFIKGQVPCSLS